MVEGREVVGVGEEEATDGDVLHDGYGEQPEGEMEESMVVDMGVEELEPMRGCECAVHYGSCKVEGMEVGVVDMEEDMGEGKVVGTVGVVVGHSMVAGMKVRMRYMSMGHISLILDCF